MPELPEVETVVRGLRPHLVGRTVTGVTVHWPRAAGTPVEELRRRLPGATVDAISRRGKYLVFQLSTGRWLLLHLKMSGNLRVEPASAPMPRHVHTVLDLDDRRQLRFHDPRKFGRVYLVADPEDVVGRLGPEPLADDFTARDFQALFAGRKGRLKPLLLNQEFIAGLGNIYADESCFRARIDPRRQAATLSRRELTRLYRAVRESLAAGIMAKGATLDAVYPGGEFQDQFQVYGRTDDPCPACGRPIRRVVLGGRSTHFCARCQR